MLACILATRIACGGQTNGFTTMMLCGSRMYLQTITYHIKNMFGLRAVLVSGGFFVCVCVFVGTGGGIYPHTDRHGRPER